MLGCYVHTAPDEISTSWKFVHKGVNRAKMWTPGAKIERFSYDLEMKTGKKKNRNKKRTEIDRFHSRGQHLCKFIGTKSLHKKRVQLPQDWFGTPTWLPFHCFGTPIWPPWRHKKTLHRTIWLVYRTDTNAPGFWLVKRTLGWKNFMPENFLEINRYFALTTHCQSNNNFSTLGFF